MKKIIPKIILFILMILIISGLTGCADHIEATTESGESLGYDRFQIVEGESSEKILVDTKTGVQYLWKREGYAGGLTVLLNRNGKPLIAEGF